jgi:hypothetical protein
MEFSLDTWRLWFKSSVRAIRENRMQKKNPAIAKGLQEIPVSQLFTLAYEIEEIWLPKIEKSRGLESQEYEFFRKLFDALLWCIVIVDRFEGLETRHVELKVLAECYRQQVLTLTKELSKFETLEELALTDSLSRYLDIVKNRVTDFIIHKKSMKP